MTTVRQISTLKDAAKVILEEQENGLYPVSFSLPKITFSDEGQRATLSPYLQAVLEENMSKLSNDKSTILKLSLKGLVDVAEGRGKVENGEDVKVKMNQLGDIICVMFSEQPDVSKLSYNDLLKLRNALETICHPKNAQWKYVKFMTLKRINKLKGENK